MKNLGASVETLKEIYKLFVRQGLELCAPLWTTSISHYDSQSLERVQKLATRIILNNSHINYTDRLSSLGLQTLSSRRSTQLLSCAEKMAKDPKYKHLLPVNTRYRTRQAKKYVEPFCKTRRFKLSSIPQFIKALNSKQ